MKTSLRILLRILVGALMGSLAGIAAYVLFYVLVWRPVSGTPTQGRILDSIPWDVTWGGGLWLLFPLGGAAIAAVRARSLVAGPSARAALGLLAFALAFTPIVRLPVLRPELVGRVPPTRDRKERALGLWSRGWPGGARGMMLVARDPEGDMRARAVRALADSRHTRRLERAGAPAGAELREALVSILRTDPLGRVRAEAARALWLHPRAFGEHPAAAETLAAALNRWGSLLPAPHLLYPPPEAWTALEAARVRPSPALRAAAVRLVPGAFRSGFGRPVGEAAGLVRQGRCSLRVIDDAVDTNGDGLYEELRIAGEAVVDPAGTYRIKPTLRIPHGSGRYTGWPSMDRRLPIGRTDEHGVLRFAARFPSGPIARERRTEAFEIHLRLTRLEDLDPRTQAPPPGHGWVECEAIARTRAWPPRRFDPRWTRAVRSGGR